MAVSHIETTLARVERDDEGLIWIRIGEGVRLDVIGFAEILAARKELAEGRRAGVIAIVPEDIDFDVQIMQVDHHAAGDAETFTAAFAIVTGSALHTKLYNLYAAFFKTAFPVKTFGDEASAVAWVREHVAPIG